MKKTFFLLILVLLLPVLSGCSEKERSYERGLELSKNGRYSEALSYFLQAVSQGESDPSIYFDMAYACLGVGDESQAASYFEKGLELSADGLSAEGAVKAGLYCRKAGKSGEAVLLLEKVLPAREEGYPELSKEARNEAESLLGKCLMDEERYQEAVDIFNVLISGGYYPTEHEILAGACYLKLSQISAACQYFDLAIKRKEISPEYFLKIYRLLYDAGAYTPAEAYLEKGQALCGKKDAMTTEEYLLRAGKTVFSDNVPTAEEDGELLFLRAALYTENGEYDAAEEIYRMMTLSDGDLSRVYCAYMKLKILTGEYDNALQLYTEVRRGEDASVLSEGAWNEIILLEKQGDYKGAYEKLTEYRKNHESTEEVRRESDFLKRILSD